jgi:hypothetical protein
MTRHPDGQDPRPQDQGDGGGQDAGEGPPAAPAASGGAASAHAFERPGRSGSEGSQRSEGPGRTPRSCPAVERVQTGVRMEKRLVKVLKALAELYDLSLGDLLEGIVLHAFAGRKPFSAPSLRRIAELERIYGLEPEPGHGARPLPAIEAIEESEATERPAAP